MSATKSPAFKFGAIGLAVVAAAALTYSLFFYGNEPAIQEAPPVAAPEPPPPAPEPPPPQDIPVDQAQPDQPPTEEPKAPEPPKFTPDQVRKARGFSG